VEITVALKACSRILFSGVILNTIEVKNPELIVKFHQARDVILVRMSRDKT
jgi:hypothetical protein